MQEGLTEDTQRMALSSVLLLGVPASRCLMAVPQLHLEAALVQHLPYMRMYASMQDSVIAIDLEWKPEYTAGVTNPVALMQLSSASVCVLLRISSMRFSLPAAVRAFLRDKTVRLGICSDNLVLLPCYTGQLLV